MQYSVVGASYQAQSLAVFHAGLTAEPLPDFGQATKKALHLLVTELAASVLADIHVLHDQVMAFIEADGDDLQKLDDATDDVLTLSWFDDDHFVINVMDATEAYQLHIEVVPIMTVEGATAGEA